MPVFFFTASALHSEFFLQLYSMYSPYLPVFGVKLYKGIVPIDQTLVVTSECGDLLKVWLLMKSNGLRRQLGRFVVLVFRLTTDTYLLLLANLHKPEWGGS